MFNSKRSISVSDKALRRVAHSIVAMAGSEVAEAKIVGDHLVDANLTGHDSHGVGMLPTYMDHVRAGLLKPNTAAKLTHDETAIMVFDGGRGYGQRVASEAMAAAIRRCRDSGLTLLALRHAHHIGRVASYAEQAVAAGLVSILFVNVTDHPPWVAPFGAKQPRFNTNPLCIALPGTETTPALLLDMATSQVAWGKARVAFNEKKKLPQGSLIDADGRTSTDPRILFEEPLGALCPSGGYKGSGLALMIELMAGVLTGGGTIQPGNPRMNGIINNVFGFIVDPQRLVDERWLGREIDALVSYVKNATPADRHGSVLLAGEPERVCRAQRLEQGIPIDAASWREIVDAAERVGLRRGDLKRMMETESAP